MRSGKVPGRPPDRMWGGPGTGTQCSVCNAPVNPDEVEFELEFLWPTQLVTYHVHVDCFAAWECERESLESAARDLKQSA